MIYLAFLYRPSTNSSMVFQFPTSEEFEFNIGDPNEIIRANDIIFEMFDGQFLPAAYGVTDHPDGIEDFRTRCQKQFVTEN